MATKKAAAKSSSKKSSAKKSSTKKSSARKTSTGSAKKSSVKGTSKKSAAKASSKKASSKKRSAAKRELIEPTAGDKRYVRRDREGMFSKVVNMGRSLAADRRSTSKTKVKPGQGDKGDVKRSAKKK